MEFCDARTSRAAVAYAFADVPDLDTVLLRMLDRRWIVEPSGKLLALPVDGAVPSLPHRWHFPGGWVETIRERPAVPAA